MAFSQIPKLKTITKYATCTVFAASMTSAWYYRPIADDSPVGNPTDDGNDERNHQHHHQHHTIHHQQTPQQQQSLGPDRSAQPFCSPYTSPPWSRSHTPLLLSWARGISIGATTLAIRLFMNTYGKYDIVNDEHYQHFLETVLSSSQSRGLITVSNHRSLFDDPGIVSCLLPLSLAIQPKYNRWGICSQEYCFNDALPGIIKGYIGAGQVLPICRGGGINQKLLLDFGRHLACGEWCHIFPEGGVWQWDDEIGGRRGNTSDDCRTQTTNNNEQQIIPATKKHKALPPSPKGKLKWGVGKLIAHAPMTPKVIPFAHVGMEVLLPQDDLTAKTRFRDNIFGGFWKDGNRSSRGNSSSRNDSDLDDTSSTVENGDNERLHVRVQFGKEITFDDLISEHEAKYGKLWKYSGRVNAEEELEKGRSRGEFHKYWDSSAEEMELYSKIAKRIEIRLEGLTKKVFDGKKKEGRQ